MVDDRKDDNPVDPMEDITSPVGTSDDGLHSQGQDSDYSTQNSGVPAVASGGTKNVMVLAIALLVAGILIFNILSDNEEEAVKEGSRNTGTIEKNVKIVPPPLPDPPTTPVVPPPPPPPPSPTSSNIGILPPGSTSANSDQVPSIKMGLSLPPERRRANTVVSGDGNIIAGVTLEGGVEGSKKPDSLLDTPAPQVDATTAGDPANMIAQGKIIDAILETAINSDLSGILRAVISRDVYAEAGKRILVPKGSRLIGTYDVSVKRGQSRIFIVWNRVLRPDGVDIVITSPGSDRLGRAGVEGNVDGKYLEIFSNAVLFSSLTVAFAYAAEKAISSEGLSERENTSGSVTTTGKPSDVAVVEAIDDFGDVVKNVAQEVVDLRPTITIDQGTRMKVFVNKDLKFPGTIESQVVYIK